MVDRDCIRDSLERFIQDLGDDESVISRISQDSIATQPEYLNHIQVYLAVVCIMAYNRNPYNGHINPSTTKGLFFFLKLQRIVNKEAQLKVPQSNVQYIIDAFSSDTRKFG